MRLLTIIFVVVFGSGCMQALGAKKLDAWGLKIEANSGIELSGGVMQYDSADNRKVMK